MILKKAEKLAAVILLSSIALKTQSAKRLASFTVRSQLLVDKVIENMKKNSIFKKGKWAIEWFDENGGIAFWCDVKVRLGLMERA